MSTPNESETAAPEPVPTPMQQTDPEPATTSAPQPVAAPQPAPAPQQPAPASQPAAGTAAYAPGTAAYGPAATPASVDRSALPPYNVMAIIAFAGAFLIPVVGIVCGHITLAEYRKGLPERGREYALAGLILGYIFTAIWIVLGVLWIVFAFTHFGHPAITPLGGNGFGGNGGNGFGGGRGFGIPTPTPGS